jgi:hypothetical protein
MPDDNIDEPITDDFLNSIPNDPLIGGSGLYGSESPMTRHSDLLKELTNFSESTQARFRNWLGLEYDDKKKDYVRKRTPMMNEQGAWAALEILQVYQVKSNFLTNMNDDVFKWFWSDIIEVVWNSFGCCYDIYEIKTTEDLSRICQGLEHSAILVLVGAEGGKYTTFLGTTIQRNENVNITPQQSQQMQPTTYERFKKMLGMK